MYKLFTNKFEYNTSSFFYYIYRILASLANKIELDVNTFSRSEDLSLIVVVVIVVACFVLSNTHIEFI